MPYLLNNVSSRSTCARAVTVALAGWLLVGLALQGTSSTSRALAQTPPAGSGALPATDAHDDEGGKSSGDVAVIPPGQDELFADMLGLGATLPGDCKFTGGEVQHTTVRATYKCASGELAIELLHPGVAPNGSAKTSRFAVVVRSGSPPAGFLDELLSRIRAGEAKFDWKWAGGVPSASPRRIARPAV